MPRAATLFVSLLLCAAPVAAQSEFEGEVKTLIAASADEHFVAMACSPRGSADYSRALDHWEKRFGATLQLLRDKAGYNEDAILDLRAEFGPGAIFPSSLYTQAEYDSYCATKTDIYQNFTANTMIPLHARVHQLIRKQQRN